mmetsp:Transcript_13590/g.23428  ORF Transcript_13590/g.23428 Transcript_13590/m.23428 type:complete len:231 (-) Transcript_13590:431-1123(-)
MEHFDKPIQGKLIHRIHNAEVTNNEIQCSTTQSMCFVNLTHLCNLNSCYFLLLHLLLNLHTHDLGAAECFDELFIVQDVAGGGAEQSQNFVLQIFELRLGSRRLHDEVHSLLLCGWLFPRHDNSQHLILEPIQSCHEIQNSQRHADFRCEMWIGQLSSNEKLEILGPLNGRIAKTNHLECPLFEGCLLQDRIKNGIKGVVNVLNEHWRTKLDACLKFAHIIHVQPEDFQL